VAIYVPPGRRKRQVLAVVAAAFVLGLGLGALIGRVSVPSLTSQIADGRVGGRRVASSIRALPLEYANAFSGSAEFSGKAEGSIAAAIARIDPQLGAYLAKAPWIGPDQGAAARRAVERVRLSAKAKANPDEFAKVAELSAATIEDIFGIESP